MMERLGLRTPPKVVLTPEEEALEIRRLKKERWAKEKKDKEKADRRQQRKIDHAKYAFTALKMHLEAKLILSTI